MKKKFKNFLLEGNMDTSDFRFKTNLTDNEINFTNYASDDYDDYADFSAIVHWYIQFDWMGDEGIDYTIYVTKIELEYTAITFKDDKDIEEEKTLIIDDPEKIDIEKVTNNQQIIVHELTIDSYTAQVEF